MSGSMVVVTGPTSALNAALLDAAQGAPQDLGGYYRPDTALADAAMRPSATLNAIIESI